MFKPMKAESVEDIAALTYPLFASPKLDGLRAMAHETAVVSKQLKPFPNVNLQKLFKLEKGLDGEFIIGTPTAKDAFRRTQSVVMSINKPIDGLVFYAFDFFSSDPFINRIEHVEMLVGDYGTDIPIKLVGCTLITSPEALGAFETEQLELGYEGVMVRSINGLYKQGRSTVKQGHLLKLKQFRDSEAEVIGFNELLHNGNEATINALGHTEHSGHKANMVPMNTLGALRVRDILTGVEFEIGTGFFVTDRREIWDARDSYMGKLVKYKYFPSGSKEKPRFPVWLGFRHPDDM